LQLVEDIAPYRQLGLTPPPLYLLINRMPAISSNARLVQQTLRLLFREHPGVEVLDSEIPAIEAFPRAAILGLPAHRVERRRPSGRLAPSALEILRDFASEVCPEWGGTFLPSHGQECSRECAPCRKFLKRIACARCSNWP
jgi:chromosome partitioning related protein ParA